MVSVLGKTLFKWNWEQSVLCIFYMKGTETKHEYTVTSRAWIYLCRGCWLAWETSPWSRGRYSNKCSRMRSMAVGEIVWGKSRMWCVRKIIPRGRKTAQWVKCFCTSWDEDLSLEVLSSGLRGPCKSQDMLIHLGLRRVPRATIALPTQPELQLDLVQGWTALLWVYPFTGMDSLLEKNETPNVFEPFNNTAVDLRTFLSSHWQLRHVKVLSFTGCNTPCLKVTAYAEAFCAISLTCLPCLCNPLM